MRSLINPPIVLALAVLCAASPTHAQTSRTDEITSQQAAKAQRVVPETSPKGEKILLRIMSSPLLSGSGGFYPWIGSIYNGTGLAGGVGYLRRAARGQRVVLTGGGSINGSTFVDAGWRLPAFTSSGRVRSRIDARWSRLQDIVFYGVGADTAVSDRSLFDWQPRTVDAGIVATPVQWLALTAGYGYLGFSTSTDISNPRAHPLPALGQTLDYGIARAGATLDWRTSPGYSTRGGFLRGEWQRYGAQSDRPYSFNQVEVEAAHLIPIVREQYVLAFRALATTTATTDGDAVPFILLPSIGGGDTVRGAANRRFQDRSRFVFTGEYRWRPSRFVDMAVFVDSGTVAPRLRDVDSQPFTTAWGIGTRLHGPAFTALRIEAARSREGWRAIFAAGQPF